MLRLSWQAYFSQDIRVFYCMAKKRILVSLFQGVGLNSTWRMNMVSVLTAACKSLFFEKVRSENDLIFLYFMNAESIQLFI